MKRVLLTIIFCCLIVISKAQSVSVEKSTFGVQVGAVGVWINNEAKLANTIALRSEIGFRIKFVDYLDNTFYMAPVITLEPKWYYNLRKRVTLEKNTQWNSANFISIQINYVPDWIIIPFDFWSWVTYYSYQFSIIPTWGIRRNIGNHFNYETGIGIGYEYISKKDNYPINLNTGSFVAINVHVRIGYRF